MRVQPPVAAARLARASSVREYGTWDIGLGMWYLGVEWEVEVETIEETGANCATISFFGINRLKLKCQKP